MICLNSFINKILYTKYTLYFILKVNDYHLNVDNYTIVGGGGGGGGGG